VLRGAANASVLKSAAAFTVDRDILKEAFIVKSDLYKEAFTACVKQGHISRGAVNTSLFKIYKINFCSGKRL